ncbi:SDR family NAD(P)-dependent oxidoreductase [Kineococcus sp. SYSU DK001]|uniref:SDR family NAD(P)-dependent oxidoreductase n=1 Tax=Kineococcus sp. SYSU DK001 TaxID=3383122 RepID=UPI003D7E749D
MPDLGLGGSRVLVVGGASGIGLACARAFAQEGARVGVLSRSPASIERALAGDLSAHRDAVRTEVADVRDDAALGGAVRGLAGRLGGLDHLVVSAGVDGEFGAGVAEVTRAGFRDVLEVNVAAAFSAVQHACPHLRRSTAPSVTFIGSDSGFVTARGMIAYGASKGALVQLTRVLAHELSADPSPGPAGGTGIRVNSVCPSITDTPMARRGLGVDDLSGAPYPVNTPEDVAWAVLFLSSPRSRAVNGVSLLSDFGYSGRSSFPA